MSIVLTYDIGTTGVKTCLFAITNRIELLAAATQPYPLLVLPNGGVEQNPDDWWDAMCSTTREIAQQLPDALARVEGISFCSQMQCFLFTDNQGVPVRNAMNFMDQRAVKQYQRIAGNGLTVAGINAGFLVHSVFHTGVVSASVKDPVWKYLWLKENHPEQFHKGAYWLDAKDAIAARMTGNICMSLDSAYATLLLDARSQTPQFSTAVAKRLGVDLKHLPPIIATTDTVGALRPQQAEELGLPAHIPVFSGGGDASLIGIGAGATEIGQTHVYMGTSGWVSTVTDHKLVDISALMATIVGALEGRYHYFAELETAGKCLEWAKQHFALNESDLPLISGEADAEQLHNCVTWYDYLNEVLSHAIPGAGKVLFTPWLHGNRCPFEDCNARGMFFNLSLDTGKTEMLRAVVEGVCYHLRWFLETSDKKVPTSPVLRFTGGGALSPVTCQILADITGKEVEVPFHPIDSGAVGAALCAAVGLGTITSLAEAGKLVEVSARFKSNPETFPTYNSQFRSFKQLYKANKSIFAQLNGS